ncbi:MAG: DUF4339 domain-containing protein, partial [Planctomycetia bacterium]|nr:DUF4339 domain-containing protein [Planctomycetia bacterium]
MIYFRCPNCHKRAEAADQMAGVIVDCPDCRQRLRIPPPQAAAPPRPQTAVAPGDGMVRFLCPYCRKKLKVPHDARGGINCKRCGQRIDLAHAPPARPRTVNSGDEPTVMTHLPDVLPEPPTPYYYSKNGVQHGPISALELRGLVNAGLLLPTDWIWKPGFPRWKPAGKARGLFPAPQTPPAPPPPPLRAAVPAPPVAAAPLPMPQTPAPAPLPTPRTPAPVAAAKTAPSSLGTGFTEMIRVNPRDVL